MAVTTPLDRVPYWTERMYRPGGGQDHLGLGSVVTERILPRLSPGINVQTVRPRYWSFYAFVLSEFWSRDLPRTRASLRGGTGRSSASTRSRAGFVITRSIEDLLSAVAASTPFW